MLLAKLKDATVLILAIRILQMFQIPSLISLVDSKNGIKKRWLLEYIV